MLEKGKRVLIPKCFCNNPHFTTNEQGVIKEIFECGCVLIELDNGKDTLHERVCLVTGG